MWVIRQCDFSGAVKPKSVIRPWMDFLDYFLRSFGFYKMPFACFLFVIARYHSLKDKQNSFF